MHHLQIEAEERKAARAEAAMAHLRRRSPLGVDWGDEPGGDGPFDFDDEQDAFDAELAQSRTFDISDYAKAYNKILDDALFESAAFDHDAHHYLEQADRELTDRAASRDAVDGERSMARAVEAFNALYGHSLNETEGWQFMSILKKARGAEGGYREDDYTDDVAYAALAAESAWGQR